MLTQQPSCAKVLENLLMEKNVMSDEIELTPNQKEFIGTQFPTPKGGVLTVTGVLGKCGTTAIFSLDCSICSLDTELWPKSSIKSVKGSLVNGRIPCGCSGKPSWTEEQAKIRVERECSKRGYILHGWSGEYKGRFTYLDLENQKTGNRWQSTTINGFMNGCGDPEEGKEKTRQSNIIDDETHTQEFVKTGKFLEGTKFWRSERKDSRGAQNYWNYHCPKCSGDEFVECGLCSGVFESYVSNLKLGQLSCRCSKGYRFTQEQREYQIKKVFDSEGGEFIGWKDKVGYKNPKSKFKWNCKESHSCETMVTDFLNKNTRCPICDTTRRKEDGRTYGFYPYRKDEQDNLYLIHFKPQGCIKVGRAFDVEARFKGSRGLLKISGCSRDEIEILQILSGTHQQVYDTEQWIHEELTERGFYHEESTWTVETFDSDCLPLLYKLVDQSGLTPVEW